MKDEDCMLLHAKRSAWLSLIIVHCFCHDSSRKANNKQLCPLTRQINKKGKSIAQSLTTQSRVEPDNPTELNGYQSLHGRS
jgi:hypothetical protein